MTAPRPSPAQARLLRFAAERPEQFIIGWFGEVRVGPEASRLYGDAWRTTETTKFHRATLSACVRLGWFALSLSDRNDWGSVMTFYQLTDEGRAALDGLPDSAFITVPRPKVSVDGEAARVLRALVARHERPEWVALLECPVDIGGRAHSVDLLAFNCFRSQGYRVVGYEVKVSRSDFLTELRQPEKTERSAHYCTSFYFACPAGLIKPAEVPSPYGLVHVAPTGRSRIVKNSHCLGAQPTAGLLARLLRRVTDLEGGEE